MSNKNNNPNRGKPIYLNDVLYYIVYEMDNITLISKSKSLNEGVFSVPKSKLSYKQNKK